ncbi:OTU-domain-containing protein [Xylariaceae sp. FL0804]|nr:OTU-domain-containing protein [Xylariaceae sp. FL0804]
METLELVQARHRKEQRDLQSRVTSKKKNATKKTRRGINDECATLERELKERQERELNAALLDGEDADAAGADAEPDGAAAAADQEAEEDREKGEEEEDADGSTGLTRKLRDTSLSSPPAGGVTETKKTKPTTTTTTPQSQEPQQTPAAPAPATASPPAPPPPLSSSGAGAGAGKKRNRQRERLARRAAEQSAAAEQAAREAADQPDLRAGERARLETAFRARGLVEHEIAPDGHCLFAAVADQLALLRGKGGMGKGGVEGRGGGEGEGEGHGYVATRRAATAYMAAHRDDFAPFLDLGDVDLDNGVNGEDGGDGFDGYVRRMRDTAEWGGQPELLALASRYGVEINIVQDHGRVETIRPQGEPDGDEEMKKKKKKEKGAEVEGEVEDDDDRRIWLAYYRHGYGLGEHYNSLRKQEKEVAAGRPG